MFIIKITKERPSNNYPLKISNIFSTKDFHIYPASVSYSNDGINWSSESIEKGDTVRVINANTGETLESYNRRS